MIYFGCALSAIAVLFFLADGASKLFKPEPVVKATVQLGYAESAIRPIGLALLAFTVLYVLPATSAFGAILLTGYLGGAVASNIRVQATAFNCMFPMIFAFFVWAGLALRNPQIYTALLHHGAGA
ncbi:MAG TPA: DoxX family protein [Candidatus Cybelea sp.]|jgi:hypothetical protein|nr:DoxX family protein [Candidatus Cybelea sp.]